MNKIGKRLINLTMTLGNHKFNKYHQFHDMPANSIQEQSFLSSIISKLPAINYKCKVHKFFKSNNAWKRP
jgi:hypothetical protein